MLVSMETGGIVSISTNAKTEFMIVSVSRCASIREDLTAATARMASLG